MHPIALPIDSYDVLNDISEEIHKTINLKTFAHRTIINHKDCLATMDGLAELIFKRLSHDLADTCKQLGFEPVTFTNPRFDPKHCFCADSNTDKETLAVLVFTKYWTLVDAGASVSATPVEECYDYFWYHNFDNNNAFKQATVALFTPLLDRQDTTVPVTYEMIFKNQHTVDVPKYIIEQGRDAIIKYFADLANKGAIDLAYSQFSHDTVRLADQTEIKE